MVTAANTVEECGDQATSLTVVFRSKVNIGLLRNTREKPYSRLLSGKLWVSWNNKDNSCCKSLLYWICIVQCSYEFPGQSSARLYCTWIKMGTKWKTFASHVLSLSVNWTDRTKVFAIERCQKFERFNIILNCFSASRDHTSAFPPTSIQPAFDNSTWSKKRMLTKDSLSYLLFL